MRKTTWSTIAALVLAFGVAAPAQAQAQRDRDGDDHRYGERRGDDGDLKRRGSSGEYGRVADRRDDDDDRYDDDRHDDDRDERYDRSRRHDRGNGPRFCRSGAGHPRFGWEWCRERGWDRAGARAVRWEQRGWEDVIFRIPHGDRRQTLDRRGLGEVLGDIVFGRIDARRRQLGSSVDYRGLWRTSSGGRELWITAGGVPVARLIDRDGDRRVDRVYTAER